MGIASHFQLESSHVEDFEFTLAWADKQMMGSLPGGACRCESARCGLQEQVLVDVSVRCA